MHDPFPFSPPPPWFQSYFEPLAKRLNLPILPIHAHELLFAVVLYSTVYIGAAPWLSRRLMPKRYAAFDRRTRINWDVHIVSQFQAIIICGLALRGILFDEERASGSWRARLFGYTGMGGLLTAMACGYFVWDLYITTKYVKIFGPGMLAHAISAVSVFSLGFRPYVTYYSPVFILYELSTPFNNNHWFLDKLDLTGSTLQWINGILLIAVFFSCRLIWGTVNSFFVFRDMFTAYRAGLVAGSDNSSVDPQSIGKPAGGVPGEALLYKLSVRQEVPLWLVLSYLVANLVLNGLNVYWMGKMVETVRKRFDPPFGTKGVVKGRRVAGIKFDRDVAQEESITSSSEKHMLPGDGSETRSRRRH